MKPIIRTYTGKVVNPLDLKPEDVDIRDIAHALALCNRFAGHTQVPISVGQHSVYVHRICQSQLLSPWIRKQALIHDAAEAYLGDVTKWLKQSAAMAGYREAEERAHNVICEALGVVPGDLHACVIEADILMVRYEGRHAIYGHGPDFLKGDHRYPEITLEEKQRMGSWSPWTWQKSEQEFLDVYAHLWEIR